MEETQRVRLHDLGEVHDTTEFLGGHGDADGEDGVAGFGGCDEMADRADAANTGHDGGHLGEGTSFDDLLETANLCDVKMCVVDLSGFVELESDLSVAFNARDGFDGQCRHIR